MMHFLLSFLSVNFYSCFFIALSCPENSHYEACGSACLATCNDPAVPTKCASLSCVETCQCNEGFVLDAGKCIPKADCGCVFEGRLFSPNEQLWGDDTCTKRCVCDPQTKQMSCHTASCSNGEQCKVKNGIQNCYPTSYATCTAIGYSHYHSFDGQSFNFQGTCLYKFTGLSQKNKQLTDFQVLIQNSRQGGWSRSLNKLVKVQVYGLEITLSWAYQGRIMVSPSQLVSVGSSARVITPPTHTHTSSSPIILIWMILGHASIQHPSLISSALFIPIKGKLLLHISSL